MPDFIDRSLNSHRLWIIARCFMASLFLGSSLIKLLDVNGSFKEMEDLGLEPVWFFSYVSAFILASGAYCILFDQYMWLGVVTLSTYLLLSILITHTFWNISGLEIRHTLNFVLEHFAMIGGLMSIAIASHFRQKSKQHEVLP
ncbi:DoxX family protein [Acinetobacter baumannii]|uniref:DoxX family protein n=1 Tax=Acinetobacter TaxID=469 RepID=UPI0002BA151D|nr:DoxX family membrane protein [Acinetobacter baumannii]ANC35385.1 DoxX family protein [Acinetobacter baumannii]AXX40200.1 DoxX family protein [Acinetobacter baumannii]EKT8003239.1 DoxX family protein [Acinetobacter baumannii]EKU1732617.1 DoxX family protein [Acinetobacter baumannii]EKV2313478.1 DoxX family protein [Acinetobacter baumannii]